MVVLRFFSSILFVLIVSDVSKFQESNATSCQSGATACTLVDDFSCWKKVEPTNYKKRAGLPVYELDSKTTPGNEDTTTRLKKNSQICVPAKNLVLLIEERVTTNDGFQNAINVGHRNDGENRASYWPAGFATKEKCWVLTFKLKCSGNTISKFIDKNGKALSEPK
jgi:hypothetical protein